MEKKKSIKANLEKTKTMFLSIGLIISITIVVSAFSWQSDTIGMIFTKGDGEIPEELHTVITKPKPEPPKRKEESKIKEVKKYILDVINITVDSTEIVDTEISWDPEDFIDVPIIDDGPMINPTGGNGATIAGGIPALQRFIATHVKYPTIAKENGIQGTVYLRFEVTKKGTIGKIEVLNEKVDILLQEASIDVIKILPKFKPAMYKGKKINVWFAIPISFKLNTN